MMSIFLLIAGAIALSAGVVLSFRPGAGAAMCAFMGMWAMRTSGYAAIMSETLIFWAIATIMVCAIKMGRSDVYSETKVCRSFIVGGAFVGMALGLTLGNAGVIMLSAVGAIIGGVAFAGTPRGKIYVSGIWKSVVSIGLPSVVAFSMTGITIAALLDSRGL